MSDTDSSIQVPVAPASIVEHREVLRQRIGEVEHGLAEPSFGRFRAWAAGVATRVRALEEAFAEHVHLTEEPGGLYEEILAMAPRLDARVKRLHGDHVEIESRLTRLLDALDAASEHPGEGDEAAIEEWRRDGTQLLLLLVRHRQRGIDLTHEAYRVDLGGE